MKHSIFLTIFLIPAVISQKLSLDEAQVLSDVVQSLMVSFATISTEIPEQESAQVLKIITEKGISINLKKPSQVAEMAVTSTPINYPTLITIFKKHFKEIFLVCRPKTGVHNYNMMETNKRLKRDKWIWMTILRRNDSFPEDDIEIPYDVEFIILEPIADGFNVWEQYHIFINGGKELKRERKLMARWFPATGLQNEFQSPGLISSPRNVFSRRDMKNTTLIIKKMRTSNADKRFVSFYRMWTIGSDIVDAFENTYNFRKIVVFYGPNADIDTSGITWFTLSGSDRRKLILGPFLKLSMSLYYKQPPARPLESYALEPFELDVWAVIAGWILVAAVCVRVAHLDGQFNSLDSFFNVFEAFCGQGNGADGERISIRIINTAIWVTVIAVLASYSAIIFTFAMIRKPPVPFTNMNEFVQDGSYNYSGLYTTLAYDPPDVGTKNSSLHIARQKHQMPGKYWATWPRDGVGLMCENPKVAFLMYANHLEEEYWPCALERMKESYFEVDAGIASQPFTPYITAFNEKLPLLWSSGVLFIIKQHFSYMTFTRTAPDSPPPDVDLLKHILLIVPVASVISLLILILEIIFTKCSRRTRKLKIRN